MNRTLVIEAATGRIVRVLAAPPSMLAANVRAGEALFLITNDDGQAIDESRVQVSGAGALAVTEGAPEGTSVPAYELQYIAV